MDLNHILSRPGLQRPRHPQGNFPPDVQGGGGRRLRADSVSSCKSCLVSRARKEATFLIALLQVQPERRLHRGPRVPAVRHRLEQRGLPHLRRLHQVLMILNFIKPIPVRRESLVQDVAANIQCIGMVGRGLMGLKAPLAY